MPQRQHWGFGGGGRASVAVVVPRNDGASVGVKPRGGGEASWVDPRSAIDESMGGPS